MDRWSLPTSLPQETDAQGLQQTGSLICWSLTVQGGASRRSEGRAERGLAFTLVNSDQHVCMTTAPTEPPSWPPALAELQRHHLTFRPGKCYQKDCS